MMELAARVSPVGLLTNTSAKTLLDDPDQGKADPLDSGKGRKRKPYRTLN